MKPRSFKSFIALANIVMSAVIVATFSGCSTSSPNTAWVEPGFKSIFNGENLDGWVLMEKHGSGFGVTNGVIYCAKGGGGNLLTEKEYENFAMRFEFKLEEGSNNGIGIRTPLVGDAAYLGMEIQILDEVAGESGKWGKLRPEQFHGSIYDVVAAKKGALKPVGEWNSELIIAPYQNSTYPAYPGHSPLLLRSLGRAAHGALAGAGKN